MVNTSKSPATRAKQKSRTLAFPVEFRLRIVKLYLEEEYSPKLLVEQFGISTHSIQRWVKAFRLHGAAGLEPKRPVSRKSRVAWRVAARQWLVTNGLIRIQKAGKVSPNFCQKNDHN
jgi:transposase-like protein